MKLSAYRGLPSLFLAAFMMAYRFFRKTGDRRLILLSYQVVGSLRVYLLRSLGSTESYAEGPGDILASPEHPAIYHKRSIGNLFR